MDICSEYAFNGEWFFENAREHIERDDFPWIPIGTIGGIPGWHMRLKRNPFNDNKLILFIYTSHEKPRLRCFLHSEYLRNDGAWECLTKRAVFIRHDKGGGYGIDFNIDEMDDENNGYLINGGIKIEYGFQIEAILGKNDIWTFNFHDPLFDCEYDENMISFVKNSEEDEMKLFHCHKQLLTFHSTYFDSDSNENQMIELTGSVGFHDFLQISHGVRFLETSKLFYLDALKFARKYKLFNVVHLVDEALRSMDLTVSEAIKYGLNHRLADLLNEMETSEELKEELKKVNLDKISGEMMKKCVKHFFQLVVQNKHL
uniref:BTB domain-containing protein n=1 Tax=Caenorhabditis tropicalis TaxID=1561998 RepID=A0A1I7UKS1_9PELO